MKIKFNVGEFYRLMRLYGFETIQELSEETGISSKLLYSAIERDVISKETYWLLAKYFCCHIEDLQKADYT